ncbi:MAG: glycosyltransferase family 4 protein [Xenococcaceae cyanobacterium MO_167.B27]|nr:glycosyltransferase family 4 protein [Xenococcaceae cyanobacterium MO_167.B27]
MLEEISTLEVNLSKLKISIIVSDLSSSGAGRWGGGVRPFLLAQTLRKLNYSVEMLGVAFGEVSPSIQNSDIPIVALPCQYHSGFLRATYKLINRIDGDIIYPVKLKPSSFGIALVKKLLSRRSLILDIDDWEMSWHGGDRFKYSPTPKQLLRDILKPQGALRYPDHPLYLQQIEKLSHYADAITIHNQFLQQRFGGIYIPNGKDTELFDPAKYDPEASRIKYGLEDYKILMFPGAPRPYKGVEDVLIALDQLNRPDLKLAIVGGSPYDNYDQELQEKWGKWIISLPRSPIKEMPAIVAAAHIIVVPQRNTPAAQAQFPLKLTDGMAMAKPIIATNIGDIPNILGDTGYLVESNSPEQIGKMIQYIFNNLDEAEAKGIAARKRCLMHYSLDSMAKIMQPIINKLKVNTINKSI